MRLKWGFDQQIFGRFLVGRKKTMGYQGMALDLGVMSICHCGVEKRVWFQRVILQDQRNPWAQFLGMLWGRVRIRMFLAANMDLRRRNDFNTDKTWAVALESVPIHPTLGQQKTEKATQQCWIRRARFPVSIPEKMFWVTLPRHPRYQNLNLKNFNLHFSVEIFIFRRLKFPFTRQFHRHRLF
jgi:hypothetical protein